MSSAVYGLLGRFHNPDPVTTRYLKVLKNHDNNWCDTPATPAGQAEPVLARNVWSGLQSFGIGDPNRGAENPGICDSVDVAEGKVSAEISFAVSGQIHQP